MLRTALLTAFVLAAAAPAAAQLPQPPQQRPQQQQPQQQTDDFVTCEKADGDVAIAACDRVIASGRYTGVKLSEVYNNRGYELERKKQLDRALGDYNTSIALNPNHTFAYNNRANVKFAKGDIDGSIADYCEAIRLNADYAIAYTNRGLSYEAKGDTPRAIADFRAALTKSDRFSSTASAKKTAQERLRALGQ